MGRRRDDADESYTFDLVPDGGDEPGGRAPGGDAAANAGAVVVHLEREEPQPQAVPERAPRRQRWLVAAIAVGLLAVGAVAVDVVGDRNRAAALRVASGGILDLSEPPAETWRVAADSRGPGGLVAVMGGAAVIEHYDELHGVDLDTGSRLWSVRLPDRSSECGSYALWDQRARILPTRLLVCLAGRGDDRLAVVVDDEGSVVSRRGIDLAGEDAVQPAPGGVIVTASWVGHADEPDAAVTGDPATGDVRVEGEITDGYDVRVRLLDAVTGDVRWEHVVEFETVRDGYGCVEFTEGGRSAEIELRGELHVAAEGDLLWVSGCGIDAWFTQAGHRLDFAVGVGWSTHGTAVRALDGGDYVGSAAGGRVDATADGDRLLGPDGRVRRELGGHLLVPRASDGGASAVYLVRVAQESVAVDRDGRTLWTSELRVQALLAQASGVAVVADAAGRVVGLDLGSGEEIWAHRDLLSKVEGEEVWGSVGNLVLSVFTDGRRVALVWPALDREEISVHWAALDVATGAVVWERTLQHDTWGTDLAADGRLLRWSPTAISGLG
jgi:outer membrane protein assembly factor BamB